MEFGHVEQNETFRVIWTRIYLSKFLSEIYGPSGWVSKATEVIVYRGRMVRDFLGSVSRKPRHASVYD
jgi:hypothetical protein